MTIVRIIIGVVCWWDGRGRRGVCISAIAPIRLKGGRPRGIVWNTHSYCSVIGVRTECAICVVMRLLNMRVIWKNYVEIGVGKEQRKAYRM